MLAMAMLAWLVSPLGDSPARAMGCHVPDRPTVGVDPPDHISAWEMLDGGDVAPPVLTRVPCPGETPQAPVVVTVATGAACLSAAMAAPPGPCGSSLAVEDIDGPDPHPFRLDRPPR
jgi:hypothetical protein